MARYTRRSDYLVSWVVFGKIFSIPVKFLIQCLFRSKQIYSQVIFQWHLRDYCTSAKCERRYLLFALNIEVEY